MAKKKQVDDNVVETTKVDVGVVASKGYTLTNQTKSSTVFTYIEDGEYKAVNLRSKDKVVIKEFNKRTERKARILKLKIEKNG